VDDREFARLQAVEAAVKAVRAAPGRISKAEIDAALATPAPDLPDPYAETFEETF